jgi:hypothetical protein
MHYYFEWRLNWQELSDNSLLVSKLLRTLKVQDECPAWD